MDVDGWYAAGSFLEIRGHRLFVADSHPTATAERPTLLLLHGFPTASVDWAKLWPSLTQRFRCVAPDFLGFGRSDKPRGHRYSILEQADLVEGLVAHLGLRRYHVLAHDYGDTVAQELLARDLEREAEDRAWQSVCFLNGGLFPEAHRPRPIQRLVATPLGHILIRVGARASFERALRRVFSPHTPPNREELDHYWALLQHGNGRSALPSLLGYMAERPVHRERWVGALKEAHCPVQLINGSMDPVSGAHMVQRFREVVGHGDIVELPDVGHYPQVEAPHSVLRPYLRWLDELDGPRDWDLLVTDALVFDGRGEPPVRQDVAVRDGQVVARGVGLDRGRATEIVDAQGQWLLPGLIDIHTHFDLEVELVPGLPEAVRHGNTTVVMSNCSIGLAYGHQRRHGGDPIVDIFARVENVPKEVLVRVADRAEWTTSRGYLDHLAQLPLGPNVVPMIPYSMHRVETMGLEGSVTRDPDPAERDAMHDLVETGMREGYVGFSTDALPFHYLSTAPHLRRRIPSQYGSLSELSGLLSTVRRYDRVWQATPPKDSPVDIVRLFTLTSGRLHGSPLRTTAVAAIDVESNRGLARLGRVMSVVLNRLLGGNFRLQALAAPFKTWAQGAITPLSEEIPVLRELNEPEIDDREGREAIMADPAWQARFLAMWREGKRGLSVARLRRWLQLEDYAIQRDLREMVVESSPVAEWAGETFQAVYERLVQHQAGDASAARSDLERATFDALPDPIEDDARFVLALLQRFDRDLEWWTVSANADPDGVAAKLQDPLLLPGFSDSGAHLVNMAFFDANLRALKIATQLPGGERAVARMVHRLTREPARFFGLDAGGLEVGDRADLVLIDPEALAAWEPEATVQRVHRPELLAEQLVNRPPGVVQAVWVAGRSAWSADAPAAGLGERALGQVLRARNHWPSRSIA